MYKLEIHKFPIEDIAWCTKDIGQQGYKVAPAGLEWNTPNKTKNTPFSLITYYG